jgi:hypothetical protein
MCQYDAIATPMANWDDAPRNDQPYKAFLPPASVMILTNPASNEVRPSSPEQRVLEESLKMDFTVADRAPADKLNEILWQMERGPGTRVPFTPKGIAGVTVPRTKDDDDD